MILENTKEIQASPETVWQVTLDLENWPEWTPTVQSVRRLDDGPLLVGSQARLTQPGLPEATWTVTDVEVNRRFTWQAKVRGLQVIATHEIIAAGDTTESILRLEMPGILATILSALIRPSATGSLEQENAGLKAQCELLAGNS